MVFSSTVFLFLFLPITLLLYFNPLCKKREYRNIVLLIMSLGFYGWGEPVFIFLMLLSIVVNWFLALRVDKNSEVKVQKRIVKVAVFYNLGILFIFKYLTFVLQNIGLLIHNQEIVVNIALPIGISFFTFQILSYVLDVYYGNAKVQKNVSNVALYIAMFPQLVAGPIVRYSVVAEEIQSRKENAQDFTDGFTRFVFGLGKKVMIANYLAMMVDNIFLMENRSVATLWLGCIGYALQIYFDFSGYSDMAIGLGKVFGFTFNENFNYPYISKSIPEFWRRWHISVSEWFRDYLFYPIIRSDWCIRLSNWSKKKFPKDVAKLVPTLVATMIVWTATGIWHGANWTYILWGVYYGVLISLSHIVKKPMKKWNKEHAFTNSKWFELFRIIRTMFLVCIGYVLFRADSVSHAWSYLKGMFGIGVTQGIDDVFMEYMSNAKYVLAAAFIFSLPVIPWIKENKKIPTLIKGAGVNIALVVVFILSILISIKSTYNPFIYFNF